MRHFRILALILPTLLLLLSSLALRAAPVMVQGDWLEQHMKDPDLVLIDMSMEETQYQRFHLPGAVYLPYDALLQKSRNGVTRIASRQRLYAILGVLGIKEGSHVVIYDDMGGLQAARLFWTLEQIGHPKVSVLDGGLVKWILDGRRVDNIPVEPVRVRYQGGGSGRDNDADLKQVENAVAEGSPLLLDVRTRQEYVGNARSKRSGHIPGARWWPWQQAVDFRQGFVSADPEKLRLSLAEVGAAPDSPLIVYCRSGHRSARAYLTLRRLGFNQVQMYDGSMAEWSLDPKLPVKQGLTP